MKETILAYTIIAYTIFALVGFIFGVLAVSLDEEEACTYETIAGRTNVGYIAGCEIFRPRF